MVIQEKKKELPFNGEEKQKTKKMLGQTYLQGEKIKRRISCIYLQVFRT